jgi:beta-glucosidase
MVSKYTLQIQALLSQMTLDEKIAQLGSYWIFEILTNGVLDMEKVGSRLNQGIGQITRLGGASTFDPISTAKAGNKIQRYLREQTRLGIPAILHEESCAGAMILGGSIFPEMVGVASTFQPELLEAVAKEIRKQLMAVGARQALAPVLDVLRDPRWGRSEETFGEDPVLVSQFGMAYIRGVQGPDLREGVMATAKHFIGHSLSQGGLNCNPVHMGMHDVYDIFLGPFQAAIRDAGLATIMNAYPELDGEVVAASSRILTDLLRHKLGFDGLVVSDYEAVLMLHNFHKMAPTLSKAASLGLNAGIDIELPTVMCYGDPIKAALEAGELSLETVDQAVSRNLQKKFELGLFETPYVDEGKVLEVFETPQQRELARQVARQSMVLLKNDGMLPLNKTISKLAVIGPNAANGRCQIGDYSYPAQIELLVAQAEAGSKLPEQAQAGLESFNVSIVSVLEGIKSLISENTQVLYARGCDTLDAGKEGFAEAVAAAEQADAVVLVLGDRSGLVKNCSTGEFRDTHALSLPGVQEELAQAVLATGKPVALVLINGRPCAIPELAEQSHAILEAWLPGEEGGAAVAEVLFGEVNPGGKLPLSIPRHVGQVPIFYNHKPSGGKSHFYGDYVSEKVSPLFPFGHGLSYTDFEYSDLAVSSSQVTVDESVDISLKIKNAGQTAGDEVVQLYIRDEYASMPRPVKELKAYQRLTLQPGESKTVVFHLPANMLAFYDVDYQLMLEPGKVHLMVGSSSQDIRLEGDIMVEGNNNLPVKDRVFVCPVEVL